jgi:hypothetical protein
VWVRAAPLKPSVRLLPQSMARTTISVLALLVVAVTSACMKHTDCDDNVVSQVKSPNGKFIATCYHRSCAGGSGRYTCTKIEEVPAHFWSTEGETGYVMTIGEFHPITARWLDATHLEISTPGLQNQRSAALTMRENWSGISISYK